MARSNGTLRTRPSELECIAYHEAGHAVVAVALGRAVNRVSIIPDEERDTLGHCANRKMPFFHPDYDYDRKTRALAEREILIYIAGGIAEARVRGRHNHVGARADIGMAMDMAARMSGDTEEASAYLAWLHARAKNLVAVPWHWRAVEKVAAVLLARQRISGQAVRRLFQEALDEERSEPDAAGAGR
jgi:hypothetical protein